MKKYIVFVVSVFALSSLYLVAQAEFLFPGTGEANKAWQEATQAERLENMEDRKEARAEFMETREEWKIEMEKKRAEWAAKMKTEREAFLAELKVKKEEWKVALQEKKNLFRMNAANMIGQRFDMAVRNLERALERISALEEKLETEGEDTAEAEAFLDTAEDKLTEAKEKIADVGDLIPNTDEGVTPEVFEQIKLGAREAKNLLKETHQNLIDALTTLRHLQGDDEDEEEDENEEEDEEDEDTE